MSHLSVKTVGSPYTIQLSSNPAEKEGANAYDCGSVAWRVLKDKFFDLSPFFEFFLSGGNEKTRDSTDAWGIGRVVSEISSYSSVFERLLLIPEFHASIREITENFSDYSTVEKMGRVIGTAGMGIYASTLFAGNYFPFLFIVSATCEATWNGFQIALDIRDLDVVCDLQDGVGAITAGKKRSPQQMLQARQALEDKELLLKWEIAKTACGMIGMVGIVIALGRGIPFSPSVAVGFSVIKMGESAAKLRAAWIKQSSQSSVAWKPKAVRQLPAPKGKKLLLTQA